MDTNDLRKASVAVFLATEEKVAQDLSEKLKWAADMIDTLRKQIVCQHKILVTYHEPLNMELDKKITAAKERI